MQPQDFHVCTLTSREVDELLKLDQPKEHPNACTSIFHETKNPAMEAGPINIHLWTPHRS